MSSARAGAGRGPGLHVRAARRHRGGSRTPSFEPASTSKGERAGTIVVPARRSALAAPRSARPAPRPSRPPGPHSRPFPIGCARRHRRPPYADGIPKAMATGRSSGPPATRPRAPATPVAERGAAPRPGGRRSLRTPLGGRCPTAQDHWPGGVGSLTTSAAAPRSWLKGSSAAVSGRWHVSEDPIRQVQPAAATPTGGCRNRSDLWRRASLGSRCNLRRTHRSR